jgi:tRNA(Ile)-lysidine synthase
MLPQVEVAVRRARLAGSGVLVAVSGGADSVALVLTLHDLAKRYQLELVVGHFNHGWRGLESDADEFFVVELCRDLNLPCVVGRPTGASERAEEFARRERYAFFEETTARRRLPFVVTAHTRDDQTETVLFRAIRGSGWRGLAGIPFERELPPVDGLTPRLVRPLLSVSRAEVEAALTERGQAWRIDLSNRSPKHARNRLRHEALPLLREIHPGVDAALLELAEHAAVLAQDLDVRAAKLLETVLLPGRNGSEIRLRRVELSCAFDTVVSECLRMVWRMQGWPESDMTAEHWRRLSQLAKTGGVSMFPGAVAACCADNEIRLERAAGPPRPSSAS